MAIWVQLLTKNRVPKNCWRKPTARSPPIHATKAVHMTRTDTAAGRMRRNRRTQKSFKLIVPEVRNSRTSNEVMRNPERTKKRSTPK